MTGKTITQQQITGEHGVALVKDRICALGFLFSEYSRTEAGIDAIVEVRDPGTGTPLGKLIAVQIKTTESQRYTAETEHGFDYVCRPADHQYWLAANVPVIVALVRIEDGSVYWKEVPRSGATPERRLHISKTDDVLDASAGEKLALITIDDRMPGSWLPPAPVEEPILLNALRVMLPAKLFIAQSEHRHGRSLRQALLEHTDDPPTEWVVRNGRLITFLDIENTALRHVVDTGSIEDFDTSEFALTDDVDDEYQFIELLNRTFSGQLDGHLHWSKAARALYFPPADGRIERHYSYVSTKKPAERAVVQPRKNLKGGIAYVRHSAFRHRFWRDGDNWFVIIEPAYVFTRDGTRPDGFAGERISKLKRRETNASVRGQFVMWRHLLTNLGDVTQLDLLNAAVPEPKILRFEALDAMASPLTLRDDLWAQRDENPQSNEEELPL